MIGRLAMVLTMLLFGTAHAQTPQPTSINEEFKKTIKEALEESVDPKELAPLLAAIYDQGVTATLAKLKLTEPIAAAVQAGVTAAIKDAKPEEAVARAVQLGVSEAIKQANPEEAMTRAVRSGVKAAIADAHLDRRSMCSSRKATT